MHRKNDYFSCHSLTVITIITIFGTAFQLIHSKAIKNEAISENFKSNTSNNPLCGGTILGPNGTINYMGINTEPIQCVWTLIPGSTFHKITVHHESGNLTTTESDSLLFTVIKIHSSLKPYLQEITNPNSRTSLDGGIAFIIFQTTSINVGKQFTLNYTSTNYWSDEDDRPIYEFYSMDDFGSVKYPSDGNSNYYYRPNELSSFVISNPRFDSTEQLQLDISFMDLDPNCYDYIRVYEILSQPVWESCWLCDPEQEVFIIREISAKICGSSAGYGFSSTAGFLLTFQSSSNSNGHTGFEFNWKNIDRLPEVTTEDPGVTISPYPGAVTTCGGIITDTHSGTIEYKLNEEYLPNELCTWTIRADMYQRMSFHKEISGLKGGEDILTITGFDMDILSHGPIDSRFVKSAEQLNVLYEGPEIANLYGQLFVVVFTSNAENQGNRGFRLHFEAFRDEYVYSEAHEDVGSYSESGSVSLSYSHDGWFSSFVISPNETGSGVVEMTVESIDIGPIDECHFHGLMLYEIMPAASSGDLSEVGHLELQTTLCGNEVGETFIARRGFFGFFVIIQQYSYDGGSLKMNYSRAEQRKTIR